MSDNLIATLRQAGHDYTDAAADEIEKLLAALQTARHDALEEAALVAEERYNLWHMPHPDDARPFEVCDDASACRDIAAAIRALGEKE